MQACERCGAEFTSGSNYCPECGERRTETWSMHYTKAETWRVVKRIFFWVVIVMLVQVLFMAVMIVPPMFALVKELSRG